MKDQEGRTLYIAAGVALKTTPDGKLHCHYAASAIYSFAIELAEAQLLEDIKKEAPDYSKYDMKIGELQTETV